jgi:adenylosuccinate lyase
MQDVALWHERDISHSSVERIVLPDSSLVAHYMVHRLRRLLEGLQVFPDRMMHNLKSTHGLVFSQPVLLALVHAGLSRDDAYRIVQEASAEAWSRQVDLRSILDADPRLKVVDAGVLDQAFDLTRSLSGVEHVFTALDAIEV